MNREYTFEGLRNVAPADLVNELLERADYIKAAGIVLAKAFGMEPYEAEKPVKKAAAKSTAKTKAKRKPSGGKRTNFTKESNTGRVFQETLPEFTGREFTSSAMVEAMVQRGWKTSSSFPKNTVEVYLNKAKRDGQVLRTANGWMPATPKATDSAYEGSPV